MGHVLALVLLDVPFPDIQGALGKNEKAGISVATSNLKPWVNADAQIAEDIVFITIQTIAKFAPKRVGPLVSEQLIIGTFLCYVLVWSFVSIASQSQKRKLLDRITRDQGLWINPHLASIRKGLYSNTDNDFATGDSAPNVSKPDFLRVILRSAGQWLTQLDTRECALNLALLLRHRSEM